MKILVVDTCFNKSYIVLRDESKILSSKVICSDDKNYHSAYLVPEIRNILVKNNLFIKDLDCIGVNIGPGSFTGVRAGVTIARVLCQQFNTKLAGVSSLEILSKINKENTHTTIILDARKNKVYYGEYENGIEITAPCLKDKDELILGLKENSVIITDRSIGKFLTQNGVDSIKYEENDNDFGIYLSEIVNKKFQIVSAEYNWAKVKPLYIQTPSITMPKEKINVL